MRSVAYDYYSEDLKNKSKLSCEKNFEITIDAEYVIDIKF